MRRRLQVTVARGLTCFVGRDPKLTTLVQALEQARTELTTAIVLYRAMDMTFWLPQVEAALAQVAF